MADSQAYGQAELVFLLLADKTKGRSIEEISSALDARLTLLTPTRRS